MELLCHSIFPIRRSPSLTSPGFIAVLAAAIFPTLMGPVSVQAEPRPFAPFAWAKPDAEIAYQGDAVSVEPLNGNPVGAWAGTGMPTLDMVRREKRAEVDQIPRLEPAGKSTWNRQYRLGPGDTLNFSMYDRSDLARSSVPIAPDGTISYLQAVGIKALGRSIPELRKAIEFSLSKYHKSPRVIVTPATIGSKRFTIIGRVREPGSYLLDRPTTILEGMAAAKGIEVGSIRNSAVELADMERSFLVRSGQKLNIDLADLYYRGKLSENAYLEPNDYVYIASKLKNEVYVLGSVNRPGRYKMATPLTVTRAIVEAGGYNRRAYKSRVLLVRGSIHKPEVFVIDVNDVLHGKAPDIPLENRDIVYVDDRPFQVAERALDSAIFTFVQTVTTEVINDEFFDLDIPAR